MNLNSVQMFVNAVQAGSLSAAALRHDIPLATLSRHIRELERDLNVQLLERSCRGTHLTEEGSRLYEHAIRGIEFLTEAEQAVSNEQTRLKGRLRLSMPPVFEPWWDLLGAFQTRYPDVRVSVLTTERRVNLIEDGIDVALRVGAIIHDNLLAQHVVTYRHLLVASPRLLDELGVPTSPADLHFFPCAVWGHGPSTNCDWHLGDQKIHTDATLSTNDYLHLRFRALSGEIITELPPFLASAAIRDGRLKIVLPNYLLPEQEVNLLYPSAHHVSTIVRTYLDFCRDNLSQFISIPTCHEAN